MSFAETSFICERNNYLSTQALLTSGKLNTHLCIYNYYCIKMRSNCFLLHYKNIHSCISTNLYKTRTSIHICMHIYIYITGTIFMFEVWLILIGLENRKQFLIGNKDSLVTFDWIRGGWRSDWLVRCQGLISNNYIYIYI